MMRSLTLLFLLIGLSMQKLYNVRRLTYDEGTISHPRFSADNRYIYFTASSNEYGKTCAEVYRMDLSHLDDGNPSRISRVSPGLGHSSSVSPNLDGDLGLSFESTFEKAIENQNDALDGQGCPVSKCANSNSEMCTSPHVEHFYDTYIYKNSPTDPLPQRQQDTLTPLSYNYAPSQFGQTLAYATNCKTTVTPFTGNAYDTNSTCLLINGNKPFGEDENFAVYYDFVAVGKETQSGKIRVAYHKSRFQSNEEDDPNIFPLKYVDIYDAVLEADGTTKSMYSNRLCEPNYSTSMLFPQMFQPDSDPGTLYTAIDSNGKTTVKACFNRGYTSQQITDPFYYTKQASARSDYKQIVFLRRGIPPLSSYDLYIADLEDNLNTQFTSKPFTDVSRDVNADIHLLKSVELDGTLGRVRLSYQTGDIYFEQTTNVGNSICPQIYQTDMQFNDFSSLRLLSTGLGSTDGFDLFVKNRERKIVYASDFMKPAKDATKSNVHRCYLVGCAATTKDNALTQFCNAAASTKYLGNEFELFIANFYGNIETRVTTNNYYEGDVAFDHSNKRIFYSRTSTNLDRVDIAYRDLNNIDVEVVVTDGLPAGYYGGVAVVDNNRILYHAYKPAQGNDLTNFQNILKTYQVVDTSKSEIYVYDLNKKTEFQITKLNAKSSNPTYTNDQTILFESNADNTNNADNVKKFSMYEANLDGTSVVKTLDTNPANVHSVSFASRSISDFAFVADGSAATKNTLFVGTFKAFRESTLAPDTTKAPNTVVTTLQTNVQSQTPQVTVTQTSVETTTSINGAVNTLTQSSLLLFTAFALINL